MPPSPSRALRLKSVKRFIGLLALLSISACASHPLNVLKPIKDDLYASARVNMLVVSTRAPSAVPGQIYSSKYPPLLVSLRRHLKRDEIEEQRRSV